MGQDTLDTISILKKVPLLKNISDEQRDKISNALQEEKFKAGIAVFEQGAKGDKFYMVRKGSAVVRLKQKSGEMTEIGHLGVGDVFGETALLTDKPRGAAIVAVEDLEVLSLSKKDFEELLTKDKAKIHFVTRRVGITAEKEGSTAMMQMMGVGLDIAVPPAHAERTKSATVKGILAKALEGSILMKGMQANQINMVIDQMYQINVKEGSEIVKQGNPGYNLFVVESGAYIKTQDGKSELVGVLGMFGDLSLMYDAPQKATVTCKSDGVCWLIDRYSFRRILRNESEQALKLRVEFLDGVKLLAPLTAAERMKIAEALEVVSFPANHTVCEMGEEGDAMYIVKSGEVKFYKPEGMESTPVDGGSLRRPRDSMKMVEVNIAKMGDYFGERSLLTGQPRAASVVTQTAVEFLKLDTQSFNMLFGPLEQILQDRVQSYQLPGTSRAQVDETKEPEFKAPELDDLEPLGTLGTGSFGYVRLMQHKTTGETYALKVVNKQHVVNTRQETHVIDEKVTMEAIRHPFTVNLVCTYKDKNLLYWLMEPAMGGEMFGYLQAVSTLSERETKFYSSQVILSFAYMHSKDFIYRDLKPENILFDTDGYIKITDFGFAKQVTGLTYTLCGTPDYLAPEIIRGKGHGKAVDWWAVGILIYEMLAGYSPFYHDDQMKQFELITKGDFDTPTHFSEDVKDLIKGMLVVNPYKRFGTIKGGADTIKQHTWFKDLDWNAIYNREITAPMIPKVASKTDLSNYEDADDIFTEMPYDGPEGEWDKYF